MVNLKEKIDLAIIGPGLLGTSSAQSFSNNPTIESITLYGRDKKIIDQINRLHENKAYFHGVKLSEKINASELNYEEVVKADAILIAIPSHAMGSVLEELSKHYKNNIPIITANKGIETAPPHRFSHEMVKEILGKDTPFLHLYTRAFAKSIMDGELAKSSLASEDMNLANWVKEKFENDKYKIRVTDDVIGLETAGVMKNVTAIANGLSEKLGFSRTNQANIIDEGIREWMLLSEKLRGNRKDPDEIALGDFWMSSSEDSRNYKFGLYLLDNGFSKSKIFNVLMKFKSRKYKPLLKEAKRIYEEIIVDGVTGFVNDVLRSPFILVNLFSKSPYIETLEGSYSIPPLVQICRNLGLSLPMVEGIYKIYFVDGMKTKENMKEIINGIISSNVKQN